MRRVMICMLAVLLAGCNVQITPTTPVITRMPTVTEAPLGTPVPLVTNTPAPEPTPTLEDWVGEARNPGLDGEPVTVDKGVPGVTPPITVQAPPAWALYGVPGNRWPSVFRRGFGTDSQYEYNLAYINGTYGLEQYERPCARCLIDVGYVMGLNTDQWTPGNFYFGGELWSSATRGGVCQAVKLPAWAPTVPRSGQEFHAVWLISSPSDFLMRMTMTVVWPVYLDESRVWITGIAVREVGPDYGDAVIEVGC